MNKRGLIARTAAGAVGGMLLIGVAGAGLVTVDGEPRPIREGMLLLVPKGARRSTRALSDRFAYLTCHRKRAGLWPTVG